MIATLSFSIIVSPLVEGGVIGFQVKKTGVSALLFK
jgi:hypothetical protein